MGIAIGAVVAVVRLVVSPPERVAAGGEMEPVVGTELFKGVFDHVRTFAVDSLDAEELYRRAAAGVIEE
ncbi:MAG TPA: hypothetical protein VLB00_16335, partial [Gemmatimonadales bacterium]|nr:hypothetical protein [Gemmatimonadales bacterium]